MLFKNMTEYYQGILICVVLHCIAEFTTCSSKAQRGLIGYGFFTTITQLKLLRSWVLFLGASISAGIFVFHVAVVPLIFKYSKTFRRCLVFTNFVQWPPFVDFEDPASCGIEGTRNLSVEYQSKVDNCHIKLGIWHILPKSVYERLKSRFAESSDKEELNKLLDDELANSKSPVMFYCHGNSNSRAATHRIELYKFFQQMEFHTIAFDYRGYGDSTNVAPSEDGVVEDALLVYEWLRDATKQNDDKNTPPIFVWGHSLGTGISSRMVDELTAVGTPAPRGMVLEAPFNNLADEVQHHPGSRLVTWLPYYDCTIIKPFREATTSEAAFRSDRALGRNQSLPLLILHAKDDMVVPYAVGLKLYQAILASRSEGDAPVTLHTYDKSEKLGHTWMCRAKDLRDVVGHFVKKHQ